MQAEKDITFGQFRLDLTNECLWRGARAISLRPKAFAVLKLLIENPGQLVSKQKVLDTVWPGTFVGDAVLKDNIRQLREALEDDAGSPSYIETAHRRGYPRQEPPRRNGHGRDALRGSIHEVREPEPSQRRPVRRTPLTSYRPLEAAGAVGCRLLPISRARSSVSVG